jgi:hypothetical protein
VLNGGLIIGTVDGANIEIGEEVGEDNIWLFGTLTPDVEEIRHQQRLVLIFPFFILFLPLFVLPLCDSCF